MFWMCGGDGGIPCSGRTARTNHPEATIAIITTAFSFPTCHYSHPSHILIIILYLASPFVRFPLLLPSLSLGSHCPPRNTVHLPPLTNLLPFEMAMYYLQPQPPQPMMWAIAQPPTVVSFQRAPTLKPINDIPLTRSLLKVVLKDISERLYHSFRRQVRLVVHGGAVMVLHPSFTHRESTQDIDYIHRAFVTEYRALGFPDAEVRLRTCIAETAAKYNLGADWMNDHADIALPMAQDPYRGTYDPIYNASTRRENADPQTIFNERGLQLVAVPWPWAMALKLVRYAKQDPVDCAAVLRLGFAQRGIRWTLAGLEQWIMERCWPMGYSGYQPPQRAQLRERIQDALMRAFPEGTRSSTASASASSASASAVHRPPLRMSSDTSLYFMH